MAKKKTAKKKAAGARGGKRADPMSRSGCTCVSQMNAVIEDRGYQIATRLLFRAENNNGASLRLSPPLIAVSKIDGAKRSRKGPPALTCSYCPFCGVKQED